MILIDAVDEKNCELMVTDVIDIQLFFGLSFH